MDRHPAMLCNASTRLSNAARVASTQAWERMASVNAQTKEVVNDGVMGESMVTNSQIRVERIAVGGRMMADGQASY